MLAALAQNSTGLRKPIRRSQRGSMRNQALMKSCRCSFQEGPQIIQKMSRVQGALFQEWRNIIRTIGETRVQIPKSLEDKY